jgi:hypothetical protein
MDDFNMIQEARRDVIRCLVEVWTPEGFGVGQVGAESDLAGFGHMDKLRRRGNPDRVDEKEAPGKDGNRDRGD